MFHKEPNLLDQQQRTEMPYIPPGQYIDIDEKFYEPAPKYINSYESQDNREYIGVDVGNSKLIQTIPSEELKQNFGFYLYNQSTGF